MQDAGVDEHLELVRVLLGRPCGSDDLPDGEGDHTSTGEASDLGTHDSEHRLGRAEARTFTLGGIGAAAHLYQGQEQHRHGHDDGNGAPTDHSIHDALPP